MKKIFALLLVLAMVLSLVACGSSEKTDATAATVPAVENPASDVPTHDRAGTPITVPAQVERIISLAPATTQVIDTLGMKDKLIAVDTQSPLYVEGVSQLPQFDMMAPDIEQMAMLQPDLVFTSGMSYLDDNPFQALIDMGICVVEIPSSNSIASVKEDIVFTAACLGVRAEGQALAEDMQKKIDEIAAIGATITDKKTILFEIACLPHIYSFGSGTFLHEMIQIIGAENVLGEHTSWMSVTEESAVAANPDVILTNVNYIEDPIGEIMARPGWENVTAIANGQVYYIDNGHSSLPNHYIVDALIEMAVSVYPEEYAAWKES